MTAKEKAEELVFNMSECGEDGTMYVETARLCALYAINEILKVIDESILYKQKKRDFWKEVKVELENYNK
jgi:hypothetical protein